MVKLNEYEKEIIDMISEIAGPYLEHKGYNQILERDLGSSIYLSYKNSFKCRVVVFDFYNKKDIHIVYGQLLFLKILGVGQQKNLSLAEYMGIHGTIIDYRKFVFEAFKFIEEHKLLDNYPR